MEDEEEDDETIVLAPVHLLWAAMFLTQYSNESDLASKANCHEDTFRKYLWPMVRILADLKTEVVSTCDVISFSDSCLLLTACHPLLCCFLSMVILTDSL